MRNSDIYRHVTLKALVVALSAWLCTGAALALDSSPSDRTLAKNDLHSVPASQQPPPVTSDDDDEEAAVVPPSEESSPLATDSGNSVLEAAGAPLKAIGTVVDATRDAIRSYMAGNKEEAFKSLSYAADQGHAPAQWKLARMYADGDGVPRDDLRAFENFSKMCDRHAEEAPESPTAPFVSSAFIALGSYYLNGIPNSSVRANPARAREMFAYSASYFGDSEAQFILARLYLDGVGGAKDPKQALRWLTLSAEKGHRLAQAELGQLLFSGDAGPRQRARGLMWLELASQNADPVNEVWIVDANKKAVREASDTDLLAAKAYMLQHRRQTK